MSKSLFCRLSLKRVVFFLFISTILTVFAGAQTRGLQSISQKITGSPNFDVGKQYAVIIGIDKYQNWIPLKDAVTEAKSLKQILAKDYFIDEFFELYDADATASNIRKLFAQTLPAKLGVHDSLLIFYAGHGHLDESKSGFWIPVDGGTDTLAQDRWFANAQFRNYIGQLKAQRILVMADSCFSGDLLNASRGETPTIDSSYYKKAIQLTSRQILSSGASEAVPDESEFARELLGYLERNTEPYVDALSIFERIRTGMTQTLPLYGTLPGNETGASFVLFRKTEETPNIVPATSTINSVTIHILAESPYHAFAISKNNPVVNPIEIKNDTSLPSGNWIIKAQLPDDVIPTWTKEISITDMPDVFVKIPKLEYSSAYQINSLDLQKSVLLPQVYQEEASYRTQSMIGWISFATGVLGLGVGVYGYIDGKNAYNTYSSTIGSSASSNWNKVTLDGLLIWTGLGVGGGGIVLSSILFLLDPASGDRTRVNQIDNQIVQLRTSYIGDVK